MKPLTHSELAFIYAMLERCAVNAPTKGGRLYLQLLAAKVGALRDDTIDLLHKL